MDGDAVDDETFALLMASLQDERSLPKPWKPSELIDCGSTAKDDSSCCFWLCIYFHLLYIWQSSPNQADFAAFKRNLCQSTKRHQKATPADISKVATNINIPIEIVEAGVENHTMYFPYPEYALPVGEHITLVLFDGHYQIWVLEDIAGLARSHLTQPEWKAKVF